MDGRGGGSPLANGIDDGEVHVWRARLDRAHGDVERLAALLSADERDRAARFKFERDRGRYVVGRGLLRTLLASYVGCSPASLEFEYGEFSKPRLAGPGPAFNLSHSGPVALYAVCDQGELGIDVEVEDADYSREAIAERFFSPAEVEVLRSLPRDQQPRAFLTCWTRKEAFIKARGDGLSLALDSFDVTLDPSVAPAVLRTAWAPAEPSRWQLHDLSDAGEGCGIL